MERKVVLVTGSSRGGVTGEEMGKRIHNANIP